MNSRATKSTKSPGGDSPPHQNLLRGRGWEPAQAGLAYFVARGFNRRVRGDNTRSNSSVELGGEFVGKPLAGTVQTPAVPAGAVDLTPDVE